MGPWLAVFGCLVFDLSTNEVQSFQNIMLIQSHSNNDLLRRIYCFYILLCCSKKTSGTHIVINSCI